MREALNKVKAELGGEAVIMSNKKVADGIEIVAAYDKEPQPTLATGTAPQRQQRSAQPKPAMQMNKTPSLSEIIGDSGPDSLRALLEKQAEQQGQKTPQDPLSNAAQTSFGAKLAATAPQGSGQPPAAVQSPQQTNNNASSIADIKQELNELRNVLQFQVSGLLKQEQNRSHPLHGYLTNRLEQMGIAKHIAQEVVSYTPADADERQAWLFLLKLLANKIRTSGNDILSEKGVVALIGPTGTGKTTTLAKLAARYALKYGANQVAMITIDSYRIAAYEQLATYGKIIGCSVKRAQSESELTDLLYQLRDKRLVLIDTAGFGQRDSRLIKQLDTLNQDSCANIKKYLVMQANAQYKVMEHTLNAYRQISLQGCIFTKLDECYSLGEAISVAIDNKMAVSYVTDGQRVPEDIKVAETKYLISTAAKLYKKYGLVHTPMSEQHTSAMAV